MGQMRFKIPRPERVVAGAAEQACLAGGEGTPWECRTALEFDAMVIERETRESGYLYFPWNVAGRGVVVLVSGSLMERPRPYNLPVELARGTINRLRNQASQWQSAGMVIPAEFFELVNRSNEQFSRAATGQDQPAEAADRADEAIRIGLLAADLLGREYARQVLTIRRAHQSPLGTLLAARLQAPLAGKHAKRFQAAFNTAIITPNWAAIEPQIGKPDWTATDALVEWCRAREIRVCFGPLVQLDRHVLPDWLFLDDEEEIQASILSFLEAVVNRYRGKAQLWNVAARLNQEGAFDFSEEQRLRLVVEAVDRVRAIDGRTPTIVSFDQPWGEYIARKDQELTPLHFADTLVRGELGLAGIGLEINYGYWPAGTLPRDPLEFSRQLDRWSQLGVPLLVQVAAPSSDGEDAIATHPARTLPNLADPAVTPEWQQSLMEWLLPMAAAKQSVQAIAWDCWQDSLPHEWPFSGLTDAKGHAKPALQALADLRRDWIG